MDFERCQAVIASYLTSVIEKPTSVAMDDLAQGGSNFVENFTQIHVLVDLWQVDRCEGRKRLSVRNGDSTSSTSEGLEEGYEQMGENCVQSNDGE